VAVAYVDSNAELDSSITMVPAGADRWMWAIQTEDTNSTAFPGDAVFNTSETYSAAFASLGTGQYIQVLRADSQPSATSAALAFSGGLAPKGMGIACSGVDQTTPDEAFERSESGSAESLTLGIASGSTDDLVIGALSVNAVTAGFLTATGDTPTEREDMGDGGHGGGIVTCPGAAGDVNVGGSWAASGAKRCSLIGWNVNAAAAGGGTTPKGPLSNPFSGPFGGPIG
jgi:hypothetical protein